MLDCFINVIVLFVYQDVNEDPPVFNQGNYNFSVFENASVGDIVDAVSATDMDEGPVSYKLNSSQDVPFRLDANTEVFLLTEHLIEKFYQITHCM